MFPKKQRYLVYRVSHHGGLGHTFLSILNCAHYAHTHGYDLALDFSDFEYLKYDPHARALENLEFEFPSGLTLITDLGAIHSLHQSFEGQKTSDTLPPR